MKTVFICSPFRGQNAIERTRNIKVAEDLCRDAVRQGHAPMAPHLLFPRFLDEDVIEERAQGIEAGKEWLRRCDEVWVYDLNGISAGMDAELKFATSIDKPIIFWSNFPKWP